MYNGQLAIHNEGQHSLSPSRIDIIIKKSHHPTRLYDNYSSGLPTGRAAAARRTGSPALSFMDARLYQRINGQYRSHRSCHVTYRSMWNLTNQTTNNPACFRSRYRRATPPTSRASNGPFSVATWRSSTRAESSLPRGWIGTGTKKTCQEEPKKDAWKEAWTDAWGESWIEAWGEFRLAIKVNGHRRQ